MTTIRSTANKKPKLPLFYLLIFVVVIFVVLLAIAPLFHVSNLETESRNAPLRELASSKISSSAAGAISESDSSSSSSMAVKESGGYFRDIRDPDWRLKKEIFRSMQPNYSTNNHLLRKQLADPHEFWQNNFEPEFTCGMERRLPSLGDGGKWICDPHRIIGQNCLIYSIGSNGNAMFESKMKEVRTQTSRNTSEQ